MTALELEMYELLSKLNYAFYVQGTPSAIRPLMAQTKPLLEKFRLEYGEVSK